jgi:HD-GYP domain-containing protein (c-di-GMP phosphodiesterase class II)
MFEHVMDVFSSGHTAVVAFIFISILELEYSLDLGEVFVRRVRALKLSLLGVVFILTAQPHLEIEGSLMGMQSVPIALAAIFGGQAMAVLVTAVELVSYAFVGGSGVLHGAAGLLLDLLFVSILLRLLKRDSRQISIWHLVYAGLAVGMGESIALFVALSDYSVAISGHAALEQLLTEFMGTMFFGWLMRIHTDRFLGREHGRARIRTLHDTMKRSLASLSTAMIHHDLSTAGHEQRVAHLAKRVGMMLGLTDDHLEGLQLAAMVHDVGQMRVPRDILTRPRQLTSEEFELVKLHVEAGYHILKDIPYPWPVADIVRQHHEHVDGTGYPNGLRGEQLSLEAKILHACDAMEAMMSHRPFRRAYGAHRALAELEAYKSTRYDEKVVDAIVRLFRDLDYEFPAVKPGVLL